MAKEIERKWLVKFVPYKNLEQFPHKQIAQFYFDGKRYRSVMETGVREKFIETVKTGAGLVREEVENEINKNTAWEAHDAAGLPTCVVKTRYEIPHGHGLTIELDMFASGEQYIEIEFDNVEDANAFIPPCWFGEEVTNDEYHTNYALFKRLNEV